MFEAVTIDSSKLDAGSVAEALVYYGRVNLVVHAGSLPKFIEEFGGDNLIRVVESDLLQMTYDQKRYAISTVSNPFLEHSFLGVSLAKTKEGRDVRSVSDEIESVLFRKFGTSTETKHLARIISDRVSVRDFRNEVFKMVKEDALDQTLITKVVGAWLETIVPEYKIPVNFNIESMDTGKGLIFATGLDFEQINEHYHQRISPEHSSITEAYLLSCLMEVNKEIVFSADAASDLWVGPGESAMMRTKMNALGRRSKNAQTKTELFHEIEFEGRTFREVIASGEKTPRDLINLLEQEDTRKFKAWLAQQDPDASLVKEYDRAIFNEIGWTRRLPVRVGKLLVFAGLGATVDAVLGSMGLASAAAMGLSAATDVLSGTCDEFILSKLRKGWKPNQFVEGPAMEFLAERNNGDGSHKK